MQKGYYCRHRITVGWVTERLEWAELCDFNTLISPPPIKTFCNKHLTKNCLDFFWIKQMSRIKLWNHYYVINKQSKIFICLSINFNKFLSLILKGRQKQLLFKRIFTCSKKERQKGLFLWNRRRLFDQSIGGQSIL